jgi:hypothetical protein
MLFALWGGSVYRPTRDLDFTGYGNTEADAVIGTFKEVCAVTVPDDGLAFDAATRIVSVVGAGKLPNSVLVIHTARQLHRFLLTDVVRAAIHPDQPQFQAECPHNPFRTRARAAAAARNAKSLRIAPRRDMRSHPVEEGECQKRYKFAQPSCPANRSQEDLSDVPSHPGQTAPFRGSHRGWIRQLSQRAAHSFLRILPVPRRYRQRRMLATHALLRS